MQPPSSLCGMYGVHCTPAPPLSCGMHTIITFVISFTSMQPTPSLVVCTLYTIITFVINTSTSINIIVRSTWSNVVNQQSTISSVHWTRKEWKKYFHLSSSVHCQCTLLLDFTSIYLRSFIVSNSQKLKWNNCSNMFGLKIATECKYEYIWFYNIIKKNIIFLFFLRISPLETPENLW